MHHTKIVNEIIKDKRVDLNIQDDGGWTPLHLASQFGISDIAQSIIKLIPRSNPNIRTFDGKTALDLALAENRTDIIEILK